MARKTLRKKWAKRACGCPIVVAGEERAHLIECCAFFRAGRFRDPQPGAYRRRDLEQAATDIDTVLQRHRTTAPGGRSGARGSRRRSGSGR